MGRSSGDRDLARATDSMSLSANPSENVQNMQYEGSISTDGKFHGRGSIVCVLPSARFLSESA